MRTISNRSTAFLEGTLARFTTRDRASAILGDLLEISASRSVLWFYASFLRILAATAWPRAAAWFGSYAIGLCLVWLAHTIWMHWMMHWVTLAHHKTHDFFGWNALGIQYMHGFETFFALPLWFGAVYLHVRYGIGDRVVRLVLTLCGLMVASVLMEPFLAGKILCDAAALAVLVMAFWSSTWRSSLLSLAVSAVIGYFSFFCSLGIMAYLLHSRLSELDVETRQYVFLAAGMFALFAFTSSCAYLHRSWVEDPENHAELA